MKKYYIIICFALFSLSIHSQSCINYKTTNSQIPHNVTWGVFIDSQNQKWVGTTGGVALFRDSTWQTFNSTNAGFPSNFTREVTTTSKGELWIGSFTNGVYRYKAGNWTFYDPGNSNLPSTTIYDIFTDSKDTVWVATDAGIAKFNGSNWVRYNTSNVSNFPSPDIRDLDENPNKQLLLSAQPSGSWQGGLGMLQSPTNCLVYRTPVYAVASNFVACSETENNGNIWIGTDNGLSMYNSITNAWTTYTTSNSTLPSNNITDVEIYYGTTNRVWVSTTSGLASYNLGTKKWEAAITATNSCLGTNNINDIEVDKDGNVWITGPQGGLTKYTPNTIITRNEPLDEINMDFKIYPNPSKGEIHIELEIPASITIANSCGEIVWENQISDKKYTINSLKEGFYTLRFHFDDKHQLVRKLIVGD